MGGLELIQDATGWEAHSKSVTNKALKKKNTWDMNMLNNTIYVKPVTKKDKRNVFAFWMMSLYSFQKLKCNNTQIIAFVFL